MTFKIRSDKNLRRNYFNLVSNRENPLIKLMFMVSCIVDVLMIRCHL